MKPLFPFLAALACILAVPAANAADQRALANARGCFACHDMNAQKVGPAYTEVARKYAGQTGVADRLARKILDGGSGVWGSVPEPANKTAGVTEADAAKLAAWILGLK